MRSKSFEIIQRKPPPQGKERFERLPLTPLPKTEENLSSQEYNEKLKAAQERIREFKMNRVLDFIYEKFNSGSSAGLAKIENEILRTCLDLKDSDVDSAVNNFNRNFREPSRHERKFIEMVARFESENKEHPDQYLPTAEGIKSVIQYIKERHDIKLEEGQRRLFFLNDYLDAKWKIDLLEMTASGPENQPIIENLDLIQVKTSSGREHDSPQIILANHQDWLANYLITDQETGETILRKEEKPEFYRERLCNDSEVALRKAVKLLEKNPDYYQILELKNKTAEQGAYILESHLEDVIASFKSLAALTKDEIKMIEQRLTDFKHELYKHRAYFAPVKEIKSVYAVMRGRIRVVQPIVPEGQKVVKRKMG